MIIEIEKSNKNFEYRQKDQRLKKKQYKQLTWDRFLKDIWIAIDSNPKISLLDDNWNRKIEYKFWIQRKLKKRSIDI